MKGKCYVFSGSKQTNKVLLVYLECELHKIGILDAFSSYNDKKEQKKHI